MSLKKKKNSYNKRRENYHRISDAHRETLLSSASKGIYLFRCRNRRRRAVSDLPRVQFHVILWISDRTAPHSPSSCLPIHRTPSSSHSHRLGARLAISTAEIWDACNYHTIFIYSNQLDPNLYFPQAPAGLLASSYLPGRHSRHLCFLIRPRLKLFQQRGTKKVKLC